MSFCKNRIVGLGEISTQPWVIPGLDLKYCFKSLEKVLKPGNKVLDIGCGGGLVAKAIKKRFPKVEVTGVDFDKKAIEIAKAKSGGVKFVVADVLNLPFEDNQFKAVVGFHLWEHLRDLGETTQEVKRVLKKGGVFHLVVPIEGDFWTLHGWLTKFGWQAKKRLCGHMHNFKRKSLIAGLEKQGFKLIKKRNSGYLLYQLADVLFFSLLDLKKKSTSLTIEGYLEKAEKNLGYYLLWLLRTIFAILTYLESKIFAWLPGYLCHLTFVKK